VFQVEDRVGFEEVPVQLKDILRLTKVSLVVDLRIRSSLTGFTGTRARSSFPVDGIDLDSLFPSHLDLLLLCPPLRHKLLRCQLDCKHLPFPIQLLVPTLLSFLRLRLDADFSYSRKAREAVALARDPGGPFDYGGVVVFIVVIRRKRVFIVRPQGANDVLAL
jgi:hypothetical protein